MNITTSKTEYIEKLNWATTRSSLESENVCFCLCSALLTFSWGSVCSPQDAERRGPSLSLKWGKLKCHPLRVRRRERALMSEVGRLSLPLSRLSVKSCRRCCSKAPLTPECLECCGFNFRRDYTAKFSGELSLLLRYFFHDSLNILEVWERGTYVAFWLFWPHYWLL